jgi:hypothetical protein
VVAKPQNKGSQKQVPVKNGSVSVAGAATF